MVKLKKITSATIVESLVAMVIITVSLGVLFLTLSNITRRSSPVGRFKAYLESQNTLNRYKSERIFLDETRQEEGLTIESKIMTYGSFRNIRIIQVQVFDNTGRKIIIRKELINVK
jgi:Tfp pilus assembly protein PilV